MRKVLLFLPLLLASSATLAAPLSTLPWPSGGKDNLGCLAKLRHNRIDLGHIHVAPDTFAQMLANTDQSSFVHATVTARPWSLVSLALLPTANKSQFAKCARGDFDGYWRQVGANVASYSAGHVVIMEPGWEANLGSGVHPWGIDGISQAADFRACWSHAAKAIKSTFPTARIAWTNAKRFAFDFSVDDINPGNGDPATDKLINYYGLMYYDNDKPPGSQATWDANVSAWDGLGGSPRGIGAWLAYAARHGKKLGISEWGLRERSGVTAAQADDPVWIAAMARFMRNHAANIAYDAYQNNLPDEHELCPSTRYPNARAEYARDFAPRP